jgi:hypothetical protein
MKNSGNAKKRKEERNGLTLTGLLMEGIIVHGRYATWAF